MLKLIDIAKKCVDGVSVLLGNAKKRSLAQINGFAAAVALVAAGGSLSHAASALSVNQSTVYRRVIALKKDLESEIGNHRQKPGPKNKLSWPRQKELIAFLSSTRPCEVGLGTLFWDAGLVVYLIEFFFGLKISSATVKRIMRRRGLSYKRTEVRNIRRDEQYIDNWIKNLAPESLAEDIQQNFHPVFLDECCAQSQANSYSGWSVRGVRAVSPQGDRFKVNVIGCIGIFGESLFLTTDGSIDSDFVIAFLNELHTKYPDRVFAVYMDGAKMHWSARVKSFLLESKFIVCRKLPPYAPEVNPIELLWADLKNHHLKRIDRTKRDTFVDGVNAALNLLSVAISRYEKYWHAKELQYIADAFSVYNKKFCT